jgi:DNA repair photolyase
MKIRGRGALSNPSGRFAVSSSERLPEEEPEKIATTLRQDATRTILARNRSPDVPFTQSLNPYRGCEHGCIYCFARQTHAYLDLSPGQDFETQIFYKPKARELLEQELARPGYEVSPIALGMNTDAYQPAEKTLELTRGILELMLEVGHPVSLITKSALVLRDLDLLQALAAQNLVHAIVSLTTLDDELKRRMEPRTAGPAQRLSVVRELAAAGVPTGVIVAPLIPALNDHELERMLEAAAGAGARFAGYVLLRLPHELRPLFVEWLRSHYPDRAEHVLSLLRQMRGGRLNDPNFHSRQVGEGPFAALIRARFERAVRRLGLGRQAELPLATDRFKRPQPAGTQLGFF